LMIVGHPRQMEPRMTHDLWKLLLHAVLGPIPCMVRRAHPGP